MKRSGSNAEQIVAALKAQEAWLRTAALCRKHRICSATFYEWKAKYGGLEVSDARRLKTLENENIRLKKLSAGSMNAPTRCCSRQCPRHGPDERMKGGLHTQGSHSSLDNLKPNESAMQLARGKRAA
jgi:putative transposase